MSNVENFRSIYTNVDMTTAMETLHTGHVENAPTVTVSTPKKSQGVSSLGVTKRGSLVDDETFRS